MLAIVRTANWIVKFDSSASSRIVHRLENFTGYGPRKKPNAVKKKQKNKKAKGSFRHQISRDVANSGNGERRTWNGEPGTGNRERESGN